MAFPQQKCPMNEDKFLSLIVYLLLETRDTRNHISKPEAHAIQEDTTKGCVQSSLYMSQDSLWVFAMLLWHLFYSYIICHHYLFIKLQYSTRKKTKPLGNHNKQKKKFIQAWGAVCNPHTWETE